MGGATGIVEGKGTCWIAGEGTADDVVVSVDWLVAVRSLLSLLLLLAECATPAGAVAWLMLPLLRRAFLFFFPPVLLMPLVLVMALSPVSFSSAPLALLCSASVLVVFFILLLPLLSPLLPTPLSPASVVMALSEPNAVVAALAKSAERLVCWLSGACACDCFPSDLLLTERLFCATTSPDSSSAWPRDSAALSRFAWYFVQMSISAVAGRAKDSDAERSGETGGAGSGRGDTSSTLPERRVGEASCSCSDWYG